MRLARMVQMEFKQIMHHLRPVGPEGRQHWEIQQVVSAKPKELRSAVGQSLGRNKPVGTLTYSTRIPVQRGDDGEPLVSLEAAAIRDQMLPQLQDHIEAARKGLEPPPLVPVYSPHQISLPRLDRSAANSIAEVLKREFPGLPLIHRGGFEGRKMVPQPADESEPTWPGLERPPYKVANGHELVVLSGDIIKLWEGERGSEKKLPKPKAIRAKHQIMNQMFDWLRDNQGFTHGTNMAAVTPAMLQSYKEHQLTLGTAHAHLHEITYLFRLADDNHKFISLPGGNPAAKLRVPGKPEHIPTKKLTQDEARRILESAAQSENPIIRWFHPLACFGGLITSEILSIRKSEIKLIEGHWVLDLTERRSSSMKTAYRPRGIPFHPSLIPFVEWSQTRPAGHLFNMDATLTSNMLVKHIRSLGISNVLNDDREVVGHKIFKSWRTGFCSELEDLTTARSSPLPRRARGGGHSREALSGARVGEARGGDQGIERPDRRIT
jgi:integrase